MAILQRFTSTTLVVYETLIREVEQNMITYLINQANGKKIEVLDDMAQFSEGTLIALPLWEAKKKMIVSEVVLSTKVEGDETIGMRASIIQNVFVKPYEQTK